MNEINDGGPAFPGQPWPDKVGVYEKSPGMTLRDWFAGQALAGQAMDRDGWDECLGTGSTYRLAVDCYAIADAMLAERSKAK